MIVPPLLRAKSDYVLCGLRDLLTDGFEYSVDWQQLRAFNGAVLQDSRSAIQVLCYTPDRSADIARMGGNLVAELRDILVTAYVRRDSFVRQSEVEFSECVGRLSAAYSELQRAAGDILAAQLRRIHIVMGFADSAAADLRAHSLIETLGARLYSEPRLEPCLGSEWLATDLPDEVETGIATSLYAEREAEVVFPEPRLSADVADDLLTLLSVQVGSLFRRTVIRASENAFVCDNGARSITFLARHF